jgi:hypothetical protein
LPYIRLDNFYTMSSSPRIVDMSVNMVGRGDLRSTISARFAGTGRTVSADVIFGEVDAWSRLSDPRSSELFGRVQEALRVCPILSEPSLVAFRGRSLPFAAGVPSGGCLGPPPASAAPSNRYNAAGKPALYLCTVRAAVDRELPGLPSVWVQRFVVPVGNLRVADLRSPEANGEQLLAAVMWFCELAGAEGHPSQVFSSFVASVVAEEFDGMLISGVRGDAALVYSNLVMLSPSEEWRNWLSPEPPTPLERTVV